MKRQILVFTPPSEQGSEHAFSQGPTRRSSSELGRWLTHELRPKGAPQPSRRPAPIVLVAPDAPDASQEEFARWLTTDLRPRGSSVPPPAASSPPGLATSDGLDPEHAARESSPPQLAAPDSLAPQVWPELEGPRITLIPELNDDDLSVLPARPRAFALFGSPRGRRSVAAAGVVLLAFGFFLMRGPENVPGSAETAAAAEVEATPAVLLPPPPDLAPIEAEAEESVAEVEAQAAVGRRGAKWPEPASDLAPEASTDPRSRLGGPSVARFPDLPPPKLSALARDGQQAAAERDAAIRRAKGPGSPKAPGASAPTLSAQ